MQNAKTDVYERQPGFPKMKVLRDLLGLVPRVLSRVFCFPLLSLSFSVTLLPLIFVNPWDLLSLWEIIWMVGIADFIPKFPFMGFKCLLLLMPPFIMLFKSKGYWCFEKNSVSITRCLFPCQFGLFIGCGEFSNVTQWSPEILVALLDFTENFWVFFFWISELSDRFCEYFLHNKVLELLLAKDSIQMWKLFVHCVKENLKNLFSCVRICFVKSLHLMV